MASRNNNRHRRKPKPPAARRALEITRLGRQGDGIAETETGPVYVPGALAGERVEAEVRGDRGRLLDVIVPAPERVTPPCPHFGTCGGCQVQHLADAAYRDWKRGLVVTALSNRGLDGAVAPLVDAHGAGRRRVTLHARFSGRQVRIGFMPARSHELLEVGECPVLASDLDAAFAAATRLAAVFAGRAGKLDLAFTATETGLDAAIRGAGAPDLDRRMDLADAAGELDLARVSVDGETISERRQPVLTMGPARVVVPAGGFLQATAAGEAALSRMVLETCADAATAADLFCGVGPFALGLAPARPVDAFDSDTAALAALEHAVRFTPGLKPLKVTRRDLFERPLLPDELRRYAAVVFDPPRAGAEAQARELAESTVPTVVGVSCEPATFARDAAILVAGGYELERVTPIDQFRHTGHVEMVGVFRKPSA